MKQISKAELARAAEWRKRSNLTMAQLSALTGHSTSSICRFEQGTVPSSQTMGEHAVTPRAWHRYKLVCLAVDMLLRAGKKVDDWEW